MARPMVLRFHGTHRQPALPPIDVAPCQFTNLGRTAEAGKPRESNHRLPFDQRAGVEHVANRFARNVVGEGGVSLRKAAKSVSGGSTTVPPGITAPCVSVTAPAIAAYRVWAVMAQAAARDVIESVPSTLKSLTCIEHIPFQR